MNEKILHIEWKGPFPIEKAKKFNGKNDYGVYQIYGNHPVYGVDVLLYIGKAVDQTFGTRIAGEERAWLHDEDLWPMSIYFGDVDETQTDIKWGELTDQVEKLLIYSHQPACNSSNIGSIPEQALKDLHILKWEFENVFCLRFPEPDGLLNLANNPVKLAMLLSWLIRQMT